MKMQLTHAELVQVVRSHYDLPGEVEIEIVPAARGDVRPIEQDRPEVQALRREVVRFTMIWPLWRTTEKLSAIKSVRQSLGYGLADCKFIVENPEQALMNLRLLGTIRKV